MNPLTSDVPPSSDTLCSPDTTMMVSSEFSQLKSSMASLSSVAPFVWL